MRRLIKSIRIVTILLRSNILILDEFRLVDQGVYNDVLKKFLNVNRQPGFLRKSEYSNYPTEENKTILLSSAYYSDNWAYEETRTTSAQMITGNFPYFACTLPYQIAIKEGLLTRERVLSELTDPSYNEVTFMQEMEALFFTGAANGCLYEHKDISACRRIKYAFYPPELSSLVPDKRLRIPPKMHNEFRILSADIALMASSSRRNNDATSIWLNQMIFDNDWRAKYNFVYGENLEGKRVEEQALEIRKRFEEFNAVALVIDARGVGLPVLDLIMSDMYDDNTGTVYGALSSVNPEIAERCNVRDAPQVIYPILATAEFNSSIALGLREAFKEGKIGLLCNEDDFDDYAVDAKRGIVGYDKVPLEERTKLKLPYINTTLLVNELVSLQYETKGQFVKVKERSGMRKDRYSSIAYSVAIAKQIEHEWRNNMTQKSVQDLVLMFRAPQS